jgi:hypothetical protein
MRVLGSGVMGLKLLHPQNLVLAAESRGSARKPLASLALIKFIYSFNNDKTLNRMSDLLAGPDVRP